MKDKRNLFSEHKNFFLSAILIALSILIIILTAFCLNITVEMEFDKGTATANGYELTFSLMHKYMPGFPAAKYVPLPAIVVLTGFMTAAILITTLVNIVILAAYVSLNRKPCILWANFILFLASIIVVGLAIMCMASSNEASRELTSSRDFTIGTALIIQPFLILITFFLSFMFSKNIVPFKGKLAKRGNK